MRNIKDKYHFCTVWMDFKGWFTLYDCNCLLQQMGPTEPWGCVHTMSLWQSTIPIQSITSKNKSQSKKSYSVNKPSRIQPVTIYSLAFKDSVDDARIPHVCEELKERVSVKSGGFYLGFLIFYHLCVKNRNHHWDSNIPIETSFNSYES